MQHREYPPAKPFIEKALKLKLMPPTPHMRYVFLGKDYNLPVIIASDFHVHQV